MKKLNWKRFFKNLNCIDWIKMIAIIIVFIIGLGCIFKFLFVGKTEIHETPVGSYKCSGGFIKVCSGSKQVADYLGV